MIKIPNIMVYDIISLTISLEHSLEIYKFQFYGLTSDNIETQQTNVTNTTHSRNRQTNSHIPQTVLTMVIYYFVYCLNILEAHTISIIIIIKMLTRVPAIIEAIKFRDFLHHSVAFSRHSQSQSQSILSRQPLMISTLQNYT